MSKFIITLTLLLIVLISSCRKKETFPDLAKQIEGKWTIYDALITRQPTDSIIHYNPRDSAQVGQILVTKIDPLRVKVHMLVKKQSGQIVFDSSFETELFRDFEIAGMIRFHTITTVASGGYLGNEKMLQAQAEQYKNDEPTGVVGWFLAKR